MKNNKSAFWAIVFNPVIIGIYILLCYYLYALAQYGGVTRRAPIIIGSLIALVAWFTGCLIFSVRRKRKAPIPSDRETAHPTGKIINRWWLIAASVLFFSTTALTGYNIYQSATSYQGRLSWVIQEIINRRYVLFPQDNLYEDGLEGIFMAVDDAVILPEELYVSNEFELTFTADGTITAFYSFLYGKNEDGETESFLISYDRRQSDEVSVWLNGFVDADYNEQKALEPFQEMVHQIPFEDLTSNGEYYEYNIHYEGVRSWGYNTQDIVYFNDEGDIQALETADEEIIGYTTSFYATADPADTTLRFLDFTPEYSDQNSAPSEQTWEAGYYYNDGEETYFLNETLGFQLIIVDAATGSRFYALNQTVDGGESWETINPDPFSGSTGVSSGITFIDEELGFIALSRGGGSQGQLYRTTDGGLTFLRVELPEVDISSTNTETFNPFDFPEMPYEENGLLYLEVGQGQDGDYNGGTKALFQSADNGQTWLFLEEVQ